MEHQQTKPTVIDQNDRRYKAVVAMVTDGSRFGTAEELACLKMIAEAYRRIGWSMPTLPSGTSGSVDAFADQWEQTGPSFGAVVDLVSEDGVRHVALSLGNGRVLHCREGNVGVCIQRLSHMAKFIKGFYRLKGHQ